LIEQGEVAAFQPQLEAKQKAMEPHSKALNEAQTAHDLARAELDLLTSSSRKHVTLLQETRDNILKVLTIVANAPSRILLN
jgi:hypothetical protein